MAVAFVVHGLLQPVSNGCRAFLQRAHIAWRSVAWYATGAAVALVGVSAVTYVPSHPLTYLLRGLVPALVWLSKAGCTWAPSARLTPPRPGCW